MNFLLDNNLAVRIARGLNAFVSPDHHVVHFKERFPATTEDSVWMRQLAGEADWGIITADVRIGKNPHIPRAWKETGQTIFLLKPGWLGMGFWDQTQRLVKCFPEIIRATEGADRGATFVLGVNGRVNLLTRR